MSSFTELITNPLFWKILACYWVFSAAIGAMPTPKVDGSQWYQFVFRFGHILSGNVNRAAVALKVPGAPNDLTPKD
jgi:hypothetical protein